MRIFRWPLRQQKFITASKIIMVVLGVTFPFAVFAHVKWFVTSEGVHAHSHFQTDAVSFALLGGFSFFLFCCRWLDGKASNRGAIHSFLYSSSGNSHIAWVALKFAVAVLFIANIMQNNFIAPNFVAAPTHVQIALQGVLLITLILHVDLFVALLLCFALLSLTIYPVDSAIDYAIELLALAVAIYFVNPVRSRKLYKLQLGSLFFSEVGSQLGLMVLRFGLGLQLIILTLHDKFFHPGLALEFLSMHPEFNFLHLFGFSHFSDLHFVLAAGLAELAFGIVLVTNMAARVGLICILFFFTTTGIILNFEELVGHIPIIIAALVLFLFPHPKSFNFAMTIPADWESEVKPQSREAG